MAGDRTPSHPTAATAERSGPRLLVVFGAVALVCVAFGHGFILQRSVVGPTPYLTIRGDTHAYVSMIEDDFSSAKAPFRYRILVPLLARATSLPPTDALRWISYLSLWISYLVIQLTCARLGMPWPACVAGLLGIFAGAWHLDAYHNPYLTDSFGLMALCVMTYALVRGSFLLFAAAACVGVLARETCIFLMPVWLLRDPRRGALLIVVAVALLALPRVLLPPDASATLASAFQQYGRPLLSAPLVLVGKIIWSWRMVWGVLLIGICLLRGWRFIYVAGAFVALFAGACLASLLATDLGRMFALLTPLAAIGTGACFHRLLGREHALWAWGLAGLLLAQSLLAAPNLLIGEEQLRGWVEAKRALFVIGVAYGLALAVLLREDLAQAWRENRSELRTHLRALAGRTFAGRAPGNRRAEKGSAGSG